MTADRLLSEILLRLAARAAGATEGELIHFLKTVSHLEPSMPVLRAAIDLLLLTGEITAGKVHGFPVHREAAVYMLTGKEGVCL